MLSLPDTWDYSQAGLSKICKDGEDSIRSGLKELEKYGYLKRERERDSSGRMQGMIYHVYEVPPGSEAPAMATYPNKGPRISRSNTASTEPSRPQQGTPKSHSPTLDFPILGETELDKPRLDNDTQINNNLIITKGQNKELNKINPSINHDNMTTDGLMNNFDLVKQTIKQNIRYDVFEQECRRIETSFVKGQMTILQFDKAMEPYDLQILNKVIDYMVDIIISLNRDPIKIGQEVIDREVVKSKLMKVGMLDVKRVVAYLSSHTELANPKYYAISMLYNS